MRQDTKESLTENFTGWLNETWRQNSSILLMYLASALGALSKSYFDVALVGGEFNISRGHITFAFVVSAVTFPLIFETVMRTKRSQRIPNFLMYFIAYQSGFFWQTLLSQFGIG